MPSPSSTPLHLRPDQRPTPVGRGPRYRLPATSVAVSRRAPVAGLRCVSTHRPPVGVHLELFARRLVIPVPAGIGVAPAIRRRGVYVLSGACEYPLRTLEPTGVVRVDAGLAPAPVLGTLFAIWGQSLSQTMMAGFRGRVLAFVDGRRWPGSPRSIPLSRHAEIVLEVGGGLPPHPRYDFPPGL
jgi:hypothetical protein